MDQTAQHLMAQLRQNPLDPNLLDELRRYCERAGDPATWADALEHHARAASLAEADPIELGRLHFELGNLYRDRLDLSERAVEHYLSAIDFDVAQRPAIAAARAILGEAGKWDRVAALLSREAESLPVGQKRAALLRERASVLTTHLADAPAAIEALREAAGIIKEDLELKHQLATLLLDQADRQPERDAARRMREEAAEILCGMARNVADDYALAYVEAALDAVPDHEPSLRLLQSIAPRLGRADAVPARWVASLQHAPDGPLSRELRLKLAIAYRTAGQAEDARVCLQPLIDAGDSEAQALADELQPPVGKSPSKRPKPGQKRASERPSARKSDRPKGKSKSERVKVKDESKSAQLAEGARASAAPSSPASLFAIEDEIHDEPSHAAQELSSALSELRASEPESGASSPLDDLASLAARDMAAAPLTRLSPDPDRTLVEASPFEKKAIADAPPIMPELGQEEPEREELTTSGVEELRRLIAHDVHGRSDDDLTQVGPHEEEPLTNPGATDSGTMNLDSGAFESADGSLSIATAAQDAPEAEEFPLRAERDAAQAWEATDLPEETTRPRADAARLSSAPGAAPSARLPEQKTASESRFPAAQAQKAGEETSEQPADELTTLRRELRRRLRFRDRRGAAELAERLLTLGQLDPDAIAALEDQYRMTRDFRRMRDLAMRIAGAAEIPVDQRLARLREAAMLSESKLGDVEGTITAWRQVLALIAVDDEANNKLRRLLTRLSRWDELVQLLVQRAEADPEPYSRAERYREIAALQRDRRKSVEEAIHAFEHARVLDPEQPADLAALCDLYIAAGRTADAAAAFSQRIEQTSEPVERVPMLVTLASLYEHELNDLDAAYQTAEALLQIAPRHLASLDRLLRIDEQLGRWDNVVHGLERKLSLGDASARARLYARIAEIAQRNMGDADRAADAYTQALEIAPDDRALINAAAEAFDQAGRRDELTTRIVTAAQHTRDASRRFDLHQLVAERREADGDLSAAIAAREAQLAVRRDPSVLALMVALLRRTDRANDLVRRLDELARGERPSQARELRLERAAVLAEQLSNLEAAKGELTRVLEELAPDDVQVLEMLVDLCRRTDDVPRRTEAQERLIKLVTSLEAKVDLASDLVDTFEQIHDREGQMRVLRTWMGFEPQNPQPYLRIVPLLEQAGLREELLSTSDALARLAMGEEEVGEYLLRSARVALELGDYDGAWQRLVPRVVDLGDKAAEALLKQVAQQGGRADALAELYVGLAQRDEAGPRGTQRWIDAAQTYEQLAGSQEKALEAVLRAFARNLDDAGLLAEVERLSELSQAWSRLSQVYDALVRRAETPLARANILMRHAKLLEERALDVTASLARASLAFQVDPSYDVPFAEATRLARASSAYEALLGLYEKRALANIPIAARLSALLEACRVAFISLEDTPRATSYLARAVLLAGDNRALLDRIEAQASDLDREGLPPTGLGLLRALSEVYAREADEGLHRPELTILLWTRAANLRDRALGDLPGAYAALEQASLKKPADESLLDALFEVAERGKLLERLAKHLAQAADRAIDSSTASAALSRLGSLYEGPLASHDLAAETFAQLVKLNPRDPAAFNRLRGALKAGHKHKELLLAIERQLSIASDQEARVALLKEAAEVWERDLQNRFEAKDAWRKVSALSPDDKDAAEALARLRTRPTLDEFALLDGDLVVRPEDLRPTLPPEAPKKESVPAAAAQPSPEARREQEAGDSAEASAETAEGTQQPAVEPPPADAGLAHTTESEPTALREGGESVTAGADLLAALAGKVSTFSDEPPGGEERLSELERAAFEASHAHGRSSEGGGSTEAEEPWQEAEEGELTSAEPAARDEDVQPAPDADEAAQESLVAEAAQGFADETPTDLTALDSLRGASQHSEPPAPTNARSVPPALPKSIRPPAPRRD